MIGIVNIPVPALRLIVEFLACNTDRICFVLACKYLFDNRNSYLSISPVGLDSDIQKYYQKFKLKSFVKKTYLQVKALNPGQDPTNLPTFHSIFNSSDARSIRYYQSDFSVFNLDYTLTRSEHTSLKQRVFFIQVGASDKDEQPVVIEPHVTDLEFCFNSHHLVDFEKIGRASSIEYLTLPNYFSDKIRPGQMPPRLRYLNLSEEYNHTFEPGLFPDTLERLIIGRAYNHPLAPGALPCSLLTLLFQKNSNFNHFLRPASLPSNLQYLTFGRSFNQPITQDILPTSLIALEFGNNFNHPLSKMVSIENGIKGYVSLLPSNLKYLSLGSNFGYPLDGTVLHQNITHLAISDMANINKEISHLPRTVVSLTISYRIKSSLFKYIPKSVVELHLIDSDKINMSKLPSSIKRLIINTYRSSESLKFLTSEIPKSIQSIRYTHRHNYKFTPIEVRRLSSKQCLIISVNLFGGITEVKDIFLKINNLAFNTGYHELQYYNSL